MSVTMAKQDKAKVTTDELPPIPRGPDGKPVYATIRLYADDGKVLSELADQVGETIADTYRERYAATARKELKELFKARLKTLEGE